MQLGWLQTFVAVYRTGSFTKAADTLGLTQPAVTHQISRLERARGKTLFERTRSGVTPTAAADELERQVSASIDTLTGVVRHNFDRNTADQTIYLGGPPELLATRVLPDLADLILSGLRIRVSFGLADDLLRCLSSSRLDLVVSTIRPRVGGITATPLADEEFALVAGPRIAAAVPAELLLRVGPRALDQIPMLAYAETLPMIRRYWQGVFEREPDRAADAVIPDLRGLLAAVSAGAGFSVLPLYLIEAGLSSGVVRQLLEPTIPPLNTIFLAVRSGNLTFPNIAKVHAHLLTAAQRWN
ncbi:MAG: transcriptional regulator, LysR family [Frankiales bacterium]|nr:transcriptional regulator, LysR family [Frankiales bacterium]